MMIELIELGKSTLTQVLSGHIFPTGDVHVLPTRASARRPESGRAPEADDSRQHVHPRS